MAEEKQYVVGIDGGGTKTRVLVVGLDGTVLADIVGGPTHVQKVGIAKSAHVLSDLLIECVQKANCSAAGLQSVVLGIAGAGRPQTRAELEDRLLGVCTKKRFPLRHVTVETDARIALEAAFAGGPGIILIAGTGSIALYRTEDGKFLRAGGWGHILGDEGGGYSVSRDALNAVMRNYDGRCEKTLLTKKAFGHFSVSTHDELLTKIVQEHVDISSFAPLVFDAAAERDRVSHLLLVKNANELVELVRVLAMQARAKQKLPVCLMGGVLESGNVYARLVQEKVAGSLPQVLVQKPKFPAAFGAAIIGLHAFR